VDGAKIESLIVAAIPDARVDAADLQGGDHFEVTVVAETFAGRSFVDRHRMVYAALGDAMKREIHALTIRAMTPAEHERDDRSGRVDRIERS